MLDRGQILGLRKASRENLNLFCTFQIMRVRTMRWGITGKHEERCVGVRCCFNSKVVVPQVFCISCNTIYTLVLF